MAKLSMDSQDKSKERQFYEKMFSNLVGLEDGGCLTYGYDEIYNATVDTIAPGSILDVGCGAGKHSVNLAKRGFNVIAIDLTLAGLKAARKWAQENGVRVHFVQGDVENLPFRDGTFDSS